MSKSRLDRKKSSNPEIIFWKVLEEETSLQPDQIDSITKIRLPDGNPLYHDNIHDLIEIVNLLNQINFSLAFNFLKNVQSRQEISIDSPLLDEEKEQYIYTIETLQTSIEGKEGIFKCRKCGSLKTNAHDAHIRSGDEGAVVFVVCNDCGYRWSFR